MTFLLIISGLRKTSSLMAASLLLLTGAWALPATAAASPGDAIPPATRLLYSIEGRISQIPFQSGGSLLWSPNGHNYRAQMSVDIPLLGTRQQISQGVIDARGLHPTQFVDRLRQEHRVDFDATRNIVTFSDGAAPVALEAGAQDHLSAFLQLGFLLAQGPLGQQAGSIIDMPAMGIYGPDRWRFRVVGNEALSLPGGPVNAVHLVRLGSQGDEISGEIWLAPSQGWLPVRIRLTQPNGDFLEQRWQGSSAP